MNQNVVKQIVVGIAALVIMVLFSACAGVGTTAGSGVTIPSISGQVVSVDLTNHTVTLNVNGQTRTITNVPNDVLTTLQSQVGKVVSIQVTQNPDGSFRGVTTLSGSVVSVDLTNHSVTLNVNGQTRTINNIPNDVLTTLQSQVGKAVSIQVTQNSDGSNSIESGTNVTSEANETPNSNETPSVNEPGSIQFIGNVTSSGNGSIAVSMPNGSSLSLSTNGVNLEDFNGSLPGVGTRVKVEATANPDGSFTATKLSVAKSDDDASIVKFQGVTTSAVGSDRVIHFAVGNKSYSFAIASTADLGDFNNNALSIGNNVSVKVTVQFSGSTGSAIKIDNSNGQ